MYTVIEPRASRTWQHFSTTRLSIEHLRHEHIIAPMNFFRSLILD